MAQRLAGTMVAASAVEHYDYATTSRFNGVKSNTIGVKPKVLHLNLLAHECACESHRKKKSPAPDDARLSKLSDCDS